MAAVAKHAMPNIKPHALHANTDRTTTPPTVSVPN